MEDQTHVSYDSHMEKQWTIAEAAPGEFGRAFPELHPGILALLWNRGMRTREQIDVFLGPDWERDVHSPALFRNMAAAVSRVFEALERGETITVHGDYDADGVCGSAVVIVTLRDICRAFSYDASRITSFIPDREKDGYGMSVSTVEHLHVHERTNLIITVDCGISNKSAIDRAKELGIDTIVCDHHAVPEHLPADAILIHPQVPGETYPNKHLCGAAVAFKLACGLLEEARRRKANGAPGFGPPHRPHSVPTSGPLAPVDGGPVPTPPICQQIIDGYEKWLLDLVAIATVTDVMPLVGENRLLEWFGLVVLNKTRRPGLRKLVEVAGGTFGALDTYSIGFQIGPRLNAAGRMRHASIALNVLLEEDEASAAVLADELNQANVARQRASEKMYQEAIEKIQDHGTKYSGSGGLIIVVGDEWPAGLVGLVAGKLVTQYGRPAYVVGRQGDKFVGSGRGVDGFDVNECVRAAAEHLDKFGGHPQACGFSVTGEERFARAVLAMNAFAEERLGGRELVPWLRLDAELDVSFVDWAFYDQLCRFAPFGEANPRPAFVARRLIVSGISTVGADGKHLRLSVTDARGKMVGMIGFGFGAWARDTRLGDLLDVAYEVGVNEWNGSRELQFRIIDLKKPV